MISSLKKIYSIIRTYQFLKKNNSLHILPHIRDKIVDSVDFIKKDYFYKILVQNIKFDDYKKNFENHLLFQVVDYDFNKIILEKYKFKNINHPLPGVLRKTLKKNGYKVSPFCSFFWGFKIIKFFFYSLAKIFYRIKFTRINTTISSFKTIYVHNVLKLDKVQFGYMDNSNLENKFYWILNQYNSNYIFIPNLLKNFQSEKYTFSTWNNFRFSSLISFFIFLFKILSKLFLCFILLFFGKWHYLFMFDQIIELDSYSLNNQNKNVNNFFFDNNIMFNRPLWTLSNSISEDKIHLYFVSSNFDFIKFKQEDDIPHTGYKHMQWQNIIVWDKRQKDILQSFSKDNQKLNYKILGPIPSFYKSSFKCKENININSLAIFDVQPYRVYRNSFLGYPNDYYTYETLKKFYLDILDVTQNRNIKIYFKRKRSSNNIEKKYLSLLEKLQSKYTSLVEIDPDANIFSELENKKFNHVISLPFTGPSYVAKHYGIKSAFYDPTNKVINSYNDNIPLLKNKKDIERFLFNFL